MRTHCGVWRNGDLIIHRNVVDIDVINMHGVTFLTDRRILLNGMNIAIAASGQPMVADVNLPADHDRARGANPHRDIAGVSGNVEINRPADLQGFFEGALWRTGESSSSEQCGQRDRYREPRGERQRVLLEFIHSAVTPQVSYRPRAGLDTCPPSR